MTRFRTQSPGRFAPFLTVGLLPSVFLVGRLGEYNCVNDQCKAQSGTAAERGEREMAISSKEIPRHYYSLEEYFALEHASEARYEYWDGDIVCMSGGTRWHGIISGNAHSSLALALRGGRCRAFTADTAIWTPTLPPYRYPDVSVACGELKFKNVKGVDALVNPVLIVEVLSPATAVRDQQEKFVAYQAIESFHEYLLMAQDEPRVTHYTRQAKGEWARRDVTDEDASLKLGAIGCELRMREIYDGVTFLEDIS